MVGPQHWSFLVQITVFDFDLVVVVVLFKDEELRACVTCKCAAFDDVCRRAG
jgi:hypothetical protein